MAIVKNTSVRQAAVGFRADNERKVTFSLLLVDEQFNFNYEAFRIFRERVNDTWDMVQETYPQPENEEPSEPMAAVDVAVAE